MKIIFKPKFKRDTDKVKSKELLLALQEKIQKIKKAQTAETITGLKLLRGYTHHYRIILNVGEHKYRIGAMIRREKIWMVRFLPRSVVYEQFP